MGSVEPRLLELVTGELADCGPALLWGELVGHAHLKAELEEEILWPALRPNPSGGGPRPARTLLLFGPRSGGKATLASSLAQQLGAACYRLSAAALLGKWKAEAEQLLATLLAVASARAPSLVYISELEALEEPEVAGLKQQLLAALDKTQHGPVSGPTSLPPLYVVCATRRPDLLKEPLLRAFSKRYHVGLPDGGARRQVLLQALAVPGCGLSERELAAVLQRSEGFTVCQVLQLCQQALASAAAANGGSSGSGLHSLGAPLTAPAFKDFENAFCKVRLHSSPKELDTCMEWSKV